MRTATTKEGRLAGKVAIVTGGNSGMGAATVEMFVAEGARVMVAARGEDAGRELVARLGEQADFVRTDATVEADVKAMVDATVNKWGRVDCLFNNAGSGTPYRTVDEFTMEEFHQLSTVLVASSFLGVKYVAPIMKKQRSGSIINNGSTAGTMVDGSTPIYAACKAGVIHVTTVWAMELAEFGIRVNCISPGGIVTPIFWGGYDTEGPEGNARKAQRLTAYFDEILPLKRAGLPEDIAGAAVHLASDESLHTTGLNLKVDSGITLGWDRAYHSAISAERERRLAGSD